jgi:hypothetical protein
MDERDYRALIELVEERLRSVGAADLADPQHYVFFEDGEARLLDPFNRLIQMLEALDRKMAVEDKATYDAAIRSLNRSTAGEGPRAALVELARDQEIDAVKVDLSGAPDLRETRMMLRRLIGQLRESRPLPGGLA